jgi:hypothetical protein
MGGVLVMVPPVAVVLSPAAFEWLRAAGLTFYFPAFGVLLMALAAELSRSTRDDRMLWLVTVVGLLLVATWVVQQSVIGLVVTVTAAIVYDCTRRSSRAGSEHGSEPIDR